LALLRLREELAPAAPFLLLDLAPVRVDELLASPPLLPYEGLVLMSPFFRKERKTILVVRGGVLSLILHLTSQAQPGQTRVNTTGTSLPCL
jgi:hypothetical protein